MLSILGNLPKCLQDGLLMQQDNHLPIWMCGSFWVAGYEELLEFVRALEPPYLFGEELVLSSMMVQCSVGWGTIVTRFIDRATPWSVWKSSLKDLSRSKCHCFRKCHIDDWRWLKKSGWRLQKSTYLLQKSNLCLQKSDWLLQKPD